MSEAQRNASVASSMESLTCWPSPVRARAKSAAAMAWDAVTAASLSGRIVRTRRGRAPLVAERADVGAAARNLDLDDIGALVAEDHGRPRPRDHRREIDDAHALKGTRHRYPFPRSVLSAAMLEGRASLDNDRP